MLVKKTVKAAARGMLVEITEDVKQAVSVSGIRHGVAVVTACSSDTGILTAPAQDPKSSVDILTDFNRIFQGRDDFLRQDLKPRDCAARSKAAVAGLTLDLIISDSTLMLGREQGLFLAEYTDPQERSYTVKIIGR